MILEQERAALIDLFNATKGHQWKNNENWCSDKPVSEWYGVYCNDNGRVTRLWLNNNNLEGELPSSLKALDQLEQIVLPVNNLSGEFPSFLQGLKHLECLDLHYNKLTGTLPEWIGDLTDLSELTLYSNQLSETIPHSISRLTDLEHLYLSHNYLEGDLTALRGLTKLRDLDLSMNAFSGPLPEFLSEFTALESLRLHGNRFSGSISDDFAKLMDLNFLSIYGNLLSGIIPKDVSTHPNWKYLWTDIMRQGGTGFDRDVYIPGPEMEIIDINGTQITSKELYSTKQLTIFFPIGDNDLVDALLPLYDDLQSAGVEIVSYGAGWNTYTLSVIANQKMIPWLVCEGQPYDDISFYPFYIAVDNNGAVVDWTFGYGYKFAYKENLLTYLNNTFDFSKYCSSDYSLDGKVNQLQKATKGQGINIVLMGDAYSDRQIADGSYDRQMRRAYEQFFTAEPYKSYREYFNIWQVYAVSKNEGYYKGSETSFSGHFDEGTHVGGDDATVFEYTRKAIPEDMIDDALIIVMMNSDRYAGTCYMYSVNEDPGDYGRGASIAYFPADSDINQFTQILLHEAGGHGFAKLADEYVDYYTMIPDSNVQSTRMGWSNGWWKNVDFTQDASKIRWSRFISDPRYSSDDIGIYPGGLLYQYGVWRSSMDSIMRYNYGGYNVPSREAIYYRIHKLAYGSDWDYNYEDFVKYDAVNRIHTKSPDDAFSNQSVFTPTAAPVVYNYSWKESKKTDNQR